jgi:hypothetical protein
MVLTYGFGRDWATFTATSREGALQALTSLEIFFGKSQVCRIFIKLEDGQTNSYCTLCEPRLVRTYQSS